MNVKNFTVTFIKTFHHSISGLIIFSHLMKNLNVNSVKKPTDEEKYTTVCSVAGYISFTEINQARKKDETSILLDFLHWI